MLMLDLKEMQQLLIGSIFWKLELVNLKKEEKMKTKIVLLSGAVFALVACGSGEDENTSGGVSVNGDANQVFVVDGEFDDCSGVIFRYVSHFRDSSEEQAICSGVDEEDGNCAECFDDNFLLENEYLSNEGCVEERVLLGLCGSEQLIEQAQAAAAEAEE